MRPEYAPLIDLLALGDRAASSLRWMNNAGAPAVLEHLAQIAAPPTHADLDGLPASTPVHYLRQLLVFVGVLPPRIEQLERNEPWLDALLDRLPPNHASVIGPFAQWDILRRARRRAETRHYTRGSAQADRAKIMNAVKLLKWLDEQHCQVSELSQAMVEEWVGGNARRASVTVAFTAWLHKQRIVCNLKVPQRPREAPDTFPDPDEQLAKIQDLLSNNDVDLTVRVAGVLVLLMGARVSAIHRLQTSEVQVRGNRTYLLLARNPVLLPPSLGILVRRLTKQACEDGLRNGIANGPYHLFPPKLRNGAPLSEVGLANRLRRAGIAPRVGRNGALLTLAQELPPAVLAEMLGLHVNSAMRWCRAAQRDWSAYLSARVENESRTLDTSGAVRAR